MVKATTFEILANFKAVMEELQLVCSSNKSNKYNSKYNGKRFPFFVFDDDKPYGRLRTTTRYMTGKYYSDAPETFRVGYRNKVEEVMRRELNKKFRERKFIESGDWRQPRTYQETEIEYEKSCFQTLYKHINETDPQTTQYWNDIIMEFYDKSDFKKEGKSFEEYREPHITSLYSLGFIPFITGFITLPNKKFSPYYTKYNVSRKDTKVCEAKFYSNLFTGNHNFSLMRIKYPKGGKITNAGLKATEYYYYNGDKSNWSFESHSKKDDLETMLYMNDIKIPKGSKYDDLAKLLKEKLP